MSASVHAALGIGHEDAIGDAVRGCLLLRSWDARP